MWLIHVGFMSYEAGAGRRKNVMATAMKNILTIAVVTPTFFYFGWWIYGCFGQGIIPITPGDFFDSAGELLPGKTPSEGAMATFCSETYPWSANLGPNLTDHISGVFWAAFLLFSWTTASILSGALDRARAALRLSAARLHPRLGDLDPRRLVGLELVRLPPDPLGLPRLDRRPRGARRRRRVHARRPLQSRPADRQVHEGRPREDRSSRTTST